MARAKSRLPQLENAIEPTALRPQPAPNTRQEKRAARVADAAIRATGDSAAGAPSKQSSQATSNAPASPRDTTSVPESVRDRFLQIGEKWYFDNGDPAFQDRGSKLSTKSENQEVIRSFVAIAEVRRWEDINITEGTKEFRRAIWHEASLRGIPVRGYAPTELDEARLVQSMARRRQTEREAQDVPRPGSEGSETIARGGGEADHGRRRGSSEDRQPNAAPPKRVLYGTLLSHGPENFEFNPLEDMSYYIKLRTDRGADKVLWGKDLERAIQQSKSQPKAGDRVGLAHVGQEPVVVPKKERDSAGRVLREYEINTHRNAWVIETEVFFRERAELAGVVRDRSIDAKRAVDRNPALAGTYVALRGARQYAEKNFQDPHEQNRFVDTIRRTLARDIKYGAPLHAPALRDRDAQRAAERGSPEMSPAR